MEAKQLIETRRSVRKFTDQEVTKEVIEEIVQMAEFAPTWKNVQANRFIAVQDEAIKAKLAECTTHANNTNIMNSASVVMVMTIVNQRSGYERDGSFSTTKEKHWESFDAGIVAQTLCLAAHDKGLGTVILGIFDEEKVKEVVSVPEGESVSALIAIGYPDETPTAPKRKELEKVLSYR